MTDKTSATTSGVEGARTLSPMDLAKGLPSIIADLPSVLNGLRIVRTSRPSDHVSIGKRFESLAASQPDAPFLRVLGTEVSYGEANLRANRVAAILKNHGVTRGDTVGVCMTNRTEVMLAILGAAKAGASVGLLNHHQRGDVLDHSQKIIEPKVVLAGAECAETVNSIPREDWSGTLLSLIHI